MTADDVKSYFESIIDDTWDSVSAFILMNQAEESLEDEREWMILRAKDTSITLTAATTWETANTLPTDFAHPRRVYVGDQRYYEVPFEELRTWKDTPSKYAIDYVNNKIHFGGTVAASTVVTLHYKKRHATLAAGVTLLWPGHRGAYLAFRMAEIHAGAVDGDDTNFRMSPQQKSEANRLMSALKQWDGKLQNQSMDLATRPRTNTGYKSGRITEDDY